MALTGKQVRDLASRMNKQLPIPCRVATFNTLIPWLKQDNPRFRAIDFYEAVFLYDYGEVKWDNLDAKAVVQSDETADKT